MALNLNAQRINRRLTLALLFGIFAVSSLIAGENRYSDKDLFVGIKDKEAQIRKIRIEEIKQLKIVLGRRLIDNRSGELYLRLSEAYFEEYRLAFLLEGRAFERRLAEGVKGETTIRRGYSKDLLYLAIKAAEVIVAHPKNFDKLDKITYYLGLFYLELEQADKANKYFKDLVRGFPNSPYLGEAYHALGEYEYGLAHYRLAQEYLNKSLGYKMTDSISSQVQSRLAWSYYRTRNFNEAIQSMRQAINAAKRSGEKMSSVREELLRDMAIFIAESSNVEDAYQYFKEISGEDAYFPKVLERLGSYYEKNSKPAWAFKIYETLLKSSPEEQIAFRALTRVITLDLKLRRYNRALKNLERLRPIENSSKETLASKEGLRSLVRATATRAHDSFRKSQSSNSLKIANAFYLVYLRFLDTFGDTVRERDEIKLYLAEIKTELGDPNEALRLYKDVAKNGRTPFQAKAQNQIIGTLAQAIHANRQKTGSISPNEKEFVDVANELIENNDTSVEVKEAYLRSAQILAGYPDSEHDSVNRCNTIMDKWPSSPQAYTAAKLKLQILVDQNKRKKGDEDSAKELFSAIQSLSLKKEILETDKKLHNGQFAELLRGEEKRAKLGVIQNSEKDRDFASAGKGYEDFAKHSESQLIAERAYQNAVNAYREASDIPALLNVIQVWTTRFPKSEFIKDSLRETATHLLIGGQFAESGALFQILGEKKNDLISLELAARIDEASGDYLKAQSGYRVLAQKSTDPLKKAKSYLRLGLLEQARNQKLLAKNSFHSCFEIHSDLKWECGFREIELESDASKANDLSKAIQKVLMVGPKDAKQGKKIKGDESNVYYSALKYKLAFIEENRASGFIALEFPEEKLKKALSQRIQFLEALSQGYQSVLEAGGPWAISASERLGYWSWKIAQEFKHVKPGKDLDTASFTEYKKTLNQIAAPLEKKAIQNWREAYRVANQNMDLSQSVFEITDALADTTTDYYLRSLPLRPIFKLAGLNAGEHGVFSAADTKKKLLEQPKNPVYWIAAGNGQINQGNLAMAKLFFERAIELKSGDSVALNNLAVIELMGSGSESWTNALIGKTLLERAVKTDKEKNDIISFNLGALTSYYRLFVPSMKYLVSIKTLNQKPDWLSLSMVSAQGSGNSSESKKYSELLKKSDPTSAEHFDALYNQAVALYKMPAGGKNCLELLDRLGVGGLEGFSSIAYKSLHKACEEVESKTE